MFPVLPLVQVRGGSLGGGAGDARSTVAALAKEAGEVVVVDLDGLRSNRPDLDLLRDVARRNVVWADLGSRGADDVVEAFVAGASRVTVRWALVGGTRELEEIAEIADPGAVYLGLEFRGGLAPNPRAPGLTLTDVLHEAKRLGMPVVAIDLGSSPTGRHALGAVEGERWYAAPLPRADLATLGTEGWTGAIGLAPEAPR